MPRKTIFSRILADAKINNISGRTAEAKKWFRDQARKLGKGITPGKLFSEAEGRKRQQHVIGKMYFFRYDPKHKKTLPYYDRFPLIFPIEAKRKSFLGINFHYLPPKLRAALLEKLTSIANNQRYDKTTKLRLSYAVLKSTKRFKEFRPTLKRYLNSQIRSAMLLIEPQLWEVAIFLPVEQFQKASKSKVWSESRKAIR